MPEDKGLSRPEREEKVLQFWKENKIFEKSLEKKSPEGEFVFYDGPPFATGLPHYGSLLSSIIKDVVPRYKTMRGYHVRRRWGWDCHGLPIENMVEKELGLKDKREIEEKIGIAKFNKACRDSVLRFADEWKRFVDRVGRFVDYDNSYMTMSNSYMESVWWAIKDIHNKGLLYEGRKVLLYCPHCETPLAKAEVAMDNSYKDITEESVYVKFGIVGFPKAYFLAWTTTPWTLPGNVALAVGPDIEYVEAKVGDEIYVLAKERLAILTESYEIVAEHKGHEMVGMQYEPLYELEAVKATGKKVWYVTEADFVTTEDGTGIVHTAVIYGEDDYNLGLKIDLPMVPLLDAAGHFNERAPELIRGQYFKKAEKAVKADLEERGLMFKREMYTHSYPHCHRCDTALLYNALSSWFINIQKVKGKMIKLNEHINWVPEHLKHGRFLNIVENAPDWTISRNRYWASPLPIWKTESGEVHVIGSIDELKERTKSRGNKFIFVRHGEAESNVQNVVNCDSSVEYHLTEKGRREAESAAKECKGADVIYTSPFPRTKETAETIAASLGLNTSAIIEDRRIAELDFGELNGKSFDEYLDYEEKYIHSYDVPLPGGESYMDAKRRHGEFLSEVDKKHEGETIVVVTHGMGLEAVAAILEGADDMQSLKIMEDLAPETGQVISFEFKPLPHNENFELDLHRPYIDEVELETKSGEPLKRIPEVLDGWMESGSMPFAERHYPFQEEKEFKHSFPADFIAEYIAQTRTWFYYMHAMATLLFGSESFKNVVTTGNILAEDGNKMSKSKGNYTNPMLNMNKYGADSLRYYLMSSVVMQAEDTRFLDDEVRQVHSQLVNILWNTFKFYEIYAGEAFEAKAGDKHVLDRWITSRLYELHETVTEAMDAYDMVRATRPMKDFVSDFSTWYIRRSRDRFKGEDKADALEALATTRFVLREFSKLIAPVMPFIAEDIYIAVRGEGDPESVHLAEWPKGGKVDKDNLEQMAKVRQLVSQGLERRSSANIKVRQPLGQLVVKSLEFTEDYIELIKDEVNVKEVVENPELVDEVELDTKLTPELEEEGRMRDLVREIQALRKAENLEPGQKMSYTISPEHEPLFQKFGEEIARITDIEY